MVGENHFAVRRLALSLEVWPRTDNAMVNTLHEDVHGQQHDDDDQHFAREVHAITSLENLVGPAFSRLYASFVASQSLEGSAQSYPHRVKMVLNGQCDASPGPTSILWW